MDKKDRTIEPINASLGDVTDKIVNPSFASNVVKATHQGLLNLAGYEISCAVLDDGTRVIVDRSLASALGKKGGGSYWKKKKDGEAPTLPEYISASYLSPYISMSLRQKLLAPIEYQNKQGSISRGMPADTLPDICDVWITAMNDGALNPKQEITARNAYDILKAFAYIGITALVDEATGYQYERERDELQILLQKYVAPELLPWQKRFPDIFYKELFRLNGWDYTINGIKRRPGIIGKWTNVLIYDQLPEGVLEELKKKTPKSNLGNNLAKYHQSLTDDFGAPHLTQQIQKIITLFQLSDNMKHMWKQFEKLNNKKQTQIDLPFEFDNAGRTLEK